MIGSSREAVQRLVEKLVAGGSVARARGGYVVAGVRIAEEAEEAEAGTHVRVREAPDAGPVLRVVPADPTGWANPCLWYRDHQAKHRWTPSGWTCDACHPQEGPIA